MLRDLRVLIAVSAIALVVGVAAPAGAQFLYAGASFAPEIYSIDPATGGTITEAAITLPDALVEQVKGLAAHPSTGELYAVLRTTFLPDGGQRDFILSMVRPDTGEAVAIGNLGLPFAGLAFDGAGTLWGVTGDGASGGPSLYTIDSSDATPTFFMDLGNGTDGEAIAFNSGDGMMYHLSGWDDFPVEGNGAAIVFEKIDLGTMAITDIPLSGALFVNGNGLAYDATNGDFVFSVLIPFPREGKYDTGLARISTQGVVSEVGLMDEYAGGMAFSNFVPVELMSFSVE